MHIYILRVIKDDFRATNPALSSCSFSIQPEIQPTISVAQTLTCISVLWVMTCPEHAPLIELPVIANC